MDDKKYKNLIKMVLMFLVVGSMIFGLIQSGLVNLNQAVAQEEGEEGGGEEDGGIQLEINQAAIEVAKKYTEFVAKKYPDILFEAYSGSAKTRAEEEAAKWQAKLNDAQSKLNQCQVTQP